MLIDPLSSSNAAASSGISSASSLTIPFITAFCPELFSSRLFNSYSCSISILSASQCACVSWTFSLCACAVLLILSIWSFAASQNSFVASTACFVSFVAFFVAALYKTSPAVTAVIAVIIIPIGDIFIAAFQRACAAAAAFVAPVAVLVAVATFPIVLARLTYTSVFENLYSAIAVPSPITVVSTSSRLFPTSSIPLLTFGKTSFSIGSAIFI